MATLDIFSHNNVFYRGIKPEDDPSFFEVVGASVGYAYDPIYEYINNAIKFRGEEDPNYRPLEDIDGYEAYRDDLMDAKNKEHMIELKRAIDENTARREILSRASFGQHFIAGLADPINLIALPFGGPSVGLARSFFRTGASVAALQVGQETLRAPFDPNNIPMESAINVGTAFVAGGILGTAISVPATRRAKAFEATQKALGERELIHQPDINTALPTPTPERPLSQVENYELDIEMANKPRLIQKLQEKLDDAADALEARRAAFDAARTPDDLKTTKDALEEAQNAFNTELKELKKIKDTFNLHKQEYEARAVEQKLLDEMEDPLGLPKNIFTDSAAYKFITTPMKRVLLDGKATTKTKAVILGIAGDSGILLNLHKRGLRLGPSVYQKAAMRDGEWVQVYDELRNIYGAEYGKGKQTILDYDLGNVTQKLAEKAKIQPKSVNFVDYITMVNKKRMMGESAATDAESRAMKLLDDFYEKWEKRLTSTGLIGSRDYFARQSVKLDGDIAYRQGIVDDLRAKKTLTQNEQERLTLNQEIVNRLKNQKEDIDLQIQAMKEFRLMPANEEKFHPRYWNQEYVKANRAALHRILSQWYAENPFVYTFNENTGRYVRTRTDSSEEAISKRANDTIDRILGLDDVTAEGNAFYGYGRSKHFRHRDVDIPNRLVIDFIETNPVSVMKAYTAKIAPQYEFNLKFGKSIDDVLNDVEDDLLASGMERLRINRTLRDIRHLNDRVQGSVIRDPNALNYKAAIILKDLAMLNYLGSAGFATLPDFAKIMMEHELGTVWKGLFGVMSDSRVRLSAKEGRLAGEVIDILKGDAHLRFHENMINNPLNDGLMSKVRQGFFLLNGVAPMTTIFKKMDAIVRGHTLIDYSIRWTKGEATEQEIAYLARYNIGKREAEQIANAPWDRTEGGLYLPNTQQWTTGRKVESNYIDLGFDTIIARYGDEFNVERIVTDADEYAAARKKWGWKDDELGVPFGQHEYVKNIGGVVYLNFEAVPRIFAALKDTSRRAEFVEAIKKKRAEIKKMPKGQRKEMAEESLMHAEFRLKNADEFKSEKDVMDFILLHEMFHGKLLRKKGESSISYERRINNAAMKRFKQEKPLKDIKTSEDTVETFRTAMNSGIGNTVLMGTPADKPIAVDGVFYVPMHIAKQFGMKEDSKFKGYARIENGLLSMPFQFLSYSFAAANKITASIAQGQVKNRAVAIAAAMGLGYMGMELKYKDWQMDRMSLDEKIARSFDASGLAALWSDLFYTSMGVSMALGGPDIGAGIIKPKFPQEKSAVDAVTGVAGAGASYAVDVTRGVGKFIEGDYGEGTGELLRRLPGAQLFFLKDLTNETARAFIGGRY